MTLSPEVLYPNGQPRVFYRGTQTAQALRGVRGVTSWTDSLTIALIWSAVPGDVWASRKTRFVETSTVHAAYLELRNPLVFTSNSASVGDLMRALRYGEPNGLTEEDLRRVWNYLHNRLYGRAKGGEFNYVAYDEEGDELDPDDMPFSLMGNESVFTELRDEQEYAEGAELFEIGDRIAVDTYVLFDSKRVQEAARRLGFDGLVYWDIFEGCQFAIEELFGPQEDCEQIEGIDVAPDVRYEDVVTHKTYRPLYEDRIIPLWSEPSEALAAQRQEQQRGGVVAEAPRLTPAQERLLLRLLERDVEIHPDRSLGRAMVRPMARLIELGLVEIIRERMDYSQLSPGRNADIYTLTDAGHALARSLRRW